MVKEIIKEMKKDIKINLIWLNNVEATTSIATPLGIGYISGYLIDKGLKVKVHDLTFDSELKLEEEPAIYGISITTPIYNSVMKLVKQIKEKNKKNIIILGNAHATSVPEILIKEKNVDYVIVGEGERVFYELCNNILNNKSNEEIKGAYFKKENKVCFNGRQELIPNLDELPFPRHDLFPLEKYFEGKALRELGIISSRGCPFNCEFCQPYLKKTFGSNTRYRTAKNVVDEIEELKEKYGCNMVVFNDDMVNPSYIEKICNEIMNRKVKILWRCQARANLSYDLLKIMKKSGCVAISFGVESGSQKVLDAIGKSLKVEDIIKVFRDSRKVGLFTHAYIMVGNSTETLKDIEETIKLIKTIKPFSIGVSITTVYPSTNLFNRLKKEGKIDDDYLKEGNFNHILGNTKYIKISNLNQEEVRISKRRILEEFEKHKISRFVYIPLYIKDLSGIKNCFYFLKDNFSSCVSIVKTLFSISSSGSGYKYTNPKILDKQLK